MKKVMCLLICIVFIVLISSEISFSAVAATVDAGVCGDNLTYTLDDNGTLTISGTGPIYPYASPRAPWSGSKGNIKKVIIEEGVTRIGVYVFYGHTALESVTIADSVTHIDADAFYGCTSLREIDIPDSVISIGSRAFQGCGALEKITLPTGAVSIGGQVFEDTAYYKKSASWEDGILYIGNHLIAADEVIESVEIKSGTTDIAESAFGNCMDLESIEIPNGVKIIGRYAFYGCTGISDISLPDSIINIGSGAFVSTAYFQSIKESRYIYIGKYLLSVGSTVESAEVKAGTLCIADDAFASCDITDVSLPESLVSIGNNTFFCVSPFEKRKHS